LCGQGGSDGFSDVLAKVDLKLLKGDQEGGHGTFKPEDSVRMCLSWKTDF